VQLLNSERKLVIDPNELGIFTKPEYKLAYEKKVADNQHFRKR